MRIQWAAKRRAGQAFGDERQSMDTVEKIIAVGESGLWDAAETQYQQLLQTDPANLSALSGLAALYRQSGQLGKLSEIEQVIAKIAGASVTGGPSQGTGKGDNLEPPQFLCLQDFLAPADRESLLELFDSERANMEELGVTYTSGGETTRESHENTMRFQFGSYCQEQLQRLVQPRIAERLAEFCHQLGIAPFAAGNHRLRLDYTPDQGFGSIHQDVGFGARMSYLYYFHTHPKQYSGGDLILFDFDRKAGNPALHRFTRVVNRDNLLVVFRPQDFHQVTRVHALTKPLLPRDSRLSVCGFVHAEE